MLERPLGVEVEAQLRQLDRHLGVQATCGRLVDEPLVLGGDLVRLLDPRQVLAEARQQHADALALEVGRRRQGIVEVLAGHEASDGALGEREPREPLPEPGVPGQPQEYAGASALLLRWPVS